MRIHPSTTVLTETVRVEWNDGEDFVYPFGRDESSHMYKNSHIGYLYLTKTTYENDKEVYGWSGTAYGPIGTISLSHGYLVTVGGDFSAIKDIFDALGWVYPEREK